MALDKSELPFKHNIVNGIPFPTFIDQQRMDEVKDFHLCGGDLFIASYPKSGTTWTRQIVRLILNNGEDDGKSLESIPWLSAVGRIGPHQTWANLATVAAMSSPLRPFFDHAPYDMMPGGLPSASPAKYIYVARNPKDVMVSYYYHHLSGKGRFDFSGTWDIFFNLFLTGKSMLWLVV